MPNNGYIVSKGNLKGISSLPVNIVVASISNTGIKKIIKSFITEPVLFIKIQKMK
jgi:hypothetical protein